MSSLFALGDDNFRHILSWLDFGSICYLDTAVGNVDERSLWLHSLHTMDNKAVDDYRHCHSSMRWLITRGARSTSIQVTNRKDNRITDKTFAGIGIRTHSTRCTDSIDRICLINTFRVETSNFFSGMSTNSQSLILGKEQDVINNTETGVVAITGVYSEGYSDLLSINLHHCYDISDIGLKSIAYGCPNLTSVNFSQCGYISDIGISAIAQSCPHLTSINLCFCMNVSDIGVLAIAQGCPDLTLLDLNRCLNVSDTGVLAVAHRCPNLTSIDLNCSGVSDVGVSAIAKGCPYLSSIALSFCQKISDIGVSAIAQGCPDLIVINLNCCNCISDIGILAIAQGCQHLLSINLSNCRNITETCTSSLKSSHPNILFLL